MADDPTYPIGPVAYRTGPKAYGPPEPNWTERNEQVRPVDPSSDPNMEVRPSYSGRPGDIVGFSPWRLARVKQVSEEF